MFTGLIADLGTVTSLDRTEAGARVGVATSLASSLDPGASIAVNGVCLTVTEPGAEAFAAEVMNQTLTVTALARLEVGSRVNLEPALRAGDPLGGHIVQGHIDGVAEIADVSQDGFARRIRLVLPGELARYVVEHGSIALDGVSLTVAALHPDGVEVSLIPETLERTTFGEEPDQLRGRAVNVEVDVIARYAERLLQGFGTPAQAAERKAPDG
jgi:riboflavin synthase